jgi:hypothetical protein
MAFGEAGAGGTVSGPASMTTKHFESYGPQFPLASCAWIQTQEMPGATGSAFSQERSSTSPSNVPSDADIGRPWPVAPARGCVVWRKSSAAAIVDPPRDRSSAVADNVTRRAAPGGSGLTRTLPAQRTGPARSPFGRARTIRFFVVSEADREGFPSSRAVIRIKYRSPFDTPPRFQAYDRKEPGTIPIVVQVCPPSGLSSSRKSAIPTPGP